MTPPKWYVYANHAIDAMLAAVAFCAAAIVSLAVCGILGV